VRGPPGPRSPVRSAAFRTWLTAPSPVALALAP
jgi:hypothetical protein